MTPFTCIFENNCECYPQLTTFSEHGGHFGRHLGFWEKLQGDFRGVLVCDSTQFSGPILKNIACYGRLPPFGHFWANTLGLYVVLRCRLGAGSYFHIPFLHMEDTGSPGCHGRRRRWRFLPVQSMAFFRHSVFRPIPSLSLHLLEWFHGRSHLWGSRHVIAEPSVCHPDGLGCNGFHL